MRFKLFLFHQGGYFLGPEVSNMEVRWCSGCGQAFSPRPQSPRQTYCAAEPCQRERKLLWQKTKRRSDEDYVANQTKANAAWTRRNPDYWRRYRENHSGGDVSTEDLAVLLAKLLDAPVDDASSTNASASEKSRRRIFPCVVDLPLDDGSRLVLKMRVEITLIKHRSSSGFRKETT